MSLIERAEARRKSILAALDPVGQAALGQYFTPYQAALIIAGLPRVPATATKNLAFEHIEINAGGAVVKFLVQY